MKRKQPGGNRQTQSRSQPQSEATPKAPQKGAAQSAIIELGIPGLLFGQGLALIPFDFWFGVAIMSLAIPLMWWLLFRIFRGPQRLIKWGSSITAVIIYGIILWILFRPPPITVALFASPGNYADDTEIYGIKWKSNYSELSVALFNEAEIDYTNVDILIRTNLGFEDQGIAPGPNQCSLAFDMFEGLGIRIANMTLSPADPKSKAQSIPLLRPSGGSVYRMRCARFASKSRIDVRFAIIAANNQRVEPDWAVLQANYETFFRPRHLFITRCFKGDCRKVPEQIREGR